MGSDARLQPAAGKLTGRHCRADKAITLRTRLSICARKVRYKSVDEARAAALRADFPLRPYRCDRCQQWHLTSRTKGKWMPLPVE